MNFDKTRVRTVIIGGVPTDVRVDEDGRILTALTGFWDDPAGANDRVASRDIITAKAIVVGNQALEDRAKALDAKTAAEVAAADGEAKLAQALEHYQRVDLLRALGRILEQKQRDAERTAKAARDQIRTGNSTRTKRDKAEKFWGNAYLEIAFRKYPNHGEGPLALAAVGEIEDKARGDLVFAKSDDYKHRAQITVNRARTFKRWKKTPLK